MLDAIVLDLDEALDVKVCVDAEAQVDLGDLVDLDVDAEVNLEAGDEVDVDGVVRAAL